MPEVLYEEVVEVEERVVLAQDNDQLSLPLPSLTGITGEKVLRVSNFKTKICIQ